MFSLNIRRSIPHFHSRKNLYLDDLPRLTRGAWEKTLVYALGCCHIFPEFASQPCGCDENTIVMYCIGIDSGTQSTKAVAVDIENGEIAAQAHESYEILEGLPPGHLEQRPETWIAAVEATVRACLDQLGAKKGEVRGIGVSGQQHGLVALDGDDAPVRPAKLWCDTSTADQCDQFANEFGGQEGLIKLAGNAMLPGYTAPKILWLKQSEPKNFAATTSVLLPHDYINFWLTGLKRMEYGDASGTGLLDVRKREWRPELIDFIDARLHEMLPPLGSSLDAHGILRDDLRKEWGLNGDVIVSSGGGDNMMGAIGTGNIKAGVVTASLGTSGTLYGLSDTPVVDPGGEVAAFCDSTDHWLPLVCTMNVTVVSEQIRSLFSWKIPELENALATAPAGAGGLLLLPYLNGERTPNLPRGSGVVHGMRPGNVTPENLARAAVEGATLGLGYGLRRFRELGMSPREIRLTGGGSRSAAWRQICADVFNASTVGLATSEGAGLGAAMQAVFTFMNANGEATSYEALASRLVQLDESSRCHPGPDRVALYEAQRERQADLTRRLNEAGYL